MKSKLGFGIQASERMANTDKGRISKYSELFIQVGKENGVPSALLAAICSRETRGGAALKDGWGDHGNGFGLMQVDKRYHQVNGEWNSVDHIEQATGIFIETLNKVKKKYPDWNFSTQMRIAIAGYNTGIEDNINPATYDQETTHDDYSSDVIARARFYSQIEPFASAGGTPLAPIEEVSPTLPPNTVESAGKLSENSPGKNEPKKKAGQETAISARLDALFEISTQPKLLGLSLAGFALSEPEIVELALGRIEPAAMDNLAYWITYYLSDEQLGVMDKKLVAILGVSMAGGFLTPGEMKQVKRLKTALGIEEGEKKHEIVDGILPNHERLINDLSVQNISAPVGIASNIQSEEKNLGKDVRIIVSKLIRLGYLGRELIANYVDLDDNEVVKGALIEDITPPNNSLSGKGT